MTRRRALPGQRDVTNLNSGLNEVECEAADLVCKVAGSGLAILDDLAVQIELGTALGQVIDRAIYHLTQRGAKFDLDSKVVKNGKTTACYFADEIGGFAFHLVQA